MKKCFGIDAGFVENCVRLRREADARALRREIAAAKAENETPSRLQICITVNPELGMDIFDRCVNALTEENVCTEDVLFQLEFDETAPENAVAARRMVG